MRALYKRRSLRLVICKSCVLVPLCNVDGLVRVKGDYEIYKDDSVGINFTVEYKLSDLVFMFFR